MTRAPDRTPSGLTGVYGAEVQVIGEGDLRMIVSEIDGSPQDLQEADPEDTIAAVQRHDAVLTHLAATRPVLPVRFGTLVPDRAAADLLLADPAGELRRALAGVTDADEWVVQVDTQDAAGAAIEDQADGLTPGHAFFERKRSQARARADARQRAETTAHDLAVALDAMARASRLLAPLEPETVARTAYLVDRAEIEGFLAAAEGCDGANVTVHGPLPPYRFVDVRSDAVVPR